jgi:transcriptional antiterminator Rof (Rho-off)
MTEHDYSKTRKAAVDALIYWAKTGMRQFTMRDAVNDYLEASDANRPSIGGKETILAHRKIAANRLEIDCIYALSKDELSKVDRELEGIVGDLPRQGHWMKR